MIRRSYDAILLDLDGTLLADDNTVRPRAHAALQAAMARGTRVMIATGRSDGGVKAVLASLATDVPAVVFNGAGLYCPRRQRLIEERTLSNRTVQRTLDFARDRGLLPIVMRSGEKFAPPPRDEDEASALRWLEDLVFAEGPELPREFLLRVTLFARAADSGALCAEAEAAIEQPVYLTHFPLSALPHHRQSPLSVIDVQPPCRGKAEALRVLAELYGIPRERVVAVGDADNDVPMLSAAGLGVAMERSSPLARAAADRVIGSDNSDALAELVDELFA